jgi:hypothetical protein
MCCFSRVFWALLDYNEKSDNRGRNCLTVSKMANIMLEGSAALSSVLPAWTAALVVVAPLGVTFVETLNGTAGQKNGFGK